MKKILSILLLISIFSCEKSIDEPLTELTEYSPKSMFYSGGETIKEKIKLFYDDNNQVIQRIGELVTAGPKDHRQIFSDDHADTLIYMDNIVEIHSQYFPTGISDFTYVGSTLRFEDGCLMYKESHFSLTTNTIYYYYNKKGQIIRSENSNIVSLSDPTNFTSEFQYDGKGNLTLVVIQYFRYSDNTKCRTDSLWFSDYDKAPNLTKKLIIFDECFYRSLSTNNFRKYTFKRVDHPSNATQTEERTWQFDYDENGYPVY